MSQSVVEQPTAAPKRDRRDGDDKQRRWNDRRLRNQRALEKPALVYSFLSQIGQVVPNGAEGLRRGFERGELSAIEVYRRGAKLLLRECSAPSTG